MYNELQNEPTMEQDDTGKESDIGTIVISILLQITQMSGWIKAAIISFVCGLFTFYKGIDKMVNYDSGDYYPYKVVNAYVGGDAYNYIINGTYATAFFVLTAMFVLTAIGLVIIHYVSKSRVGETHDEHI